MQDAPPILLGYTPAGQGPLGYGFTPRAGHSDATSVGPFGAWSAGRSLTGVNRPRRVPRRARGQVPEEGLEPPTRGL
jgi:hypothetical protein